MSVDDFQNAGEAHGCARKVRGSLRARFSPQLYVREREEVRRYLANGRGWAVLQDGGTLKGKLYFHQGDNSEFVAAKTGKPWRAIQRRAVLISMEKPKPRKKS